jgi:hypothetical protein
MAAVEDGAQEEHERRGWFAVDPDGSRAYFSDDPTFSANAGGPEPESDPSRFDQLLAVELDQDEQDMLTQGLSDWGGPAYGSDALAVAMGFDSIDQMAVDSQSLVEAIRSNQTLSRRDWTRALVATEFAFVSTVLGTGRDQWTSINGGTEEHWFHVLRRLQRKLPTDSEALPD